MLTGLIYSIGIVVSIGLLIKASYDRGYEKAIEQNGELVLYEDLHGNFMPRRILKRRTNVIRFNNSDIVKIINELSTVENKEMDSTPILEFKNNGVYLDGVRLRTIQEFKIESKKMDIDHVPWTDVTMKLGVEIKGLDR